MDITTLMFRVVYIPFVDAHLKVGKESYAGPPATIISQQSDKIIDVSRYGDNLYGLVNRVGNKELYIDQVIDFASELYELGDYTDDNYVFNKSRICYLQRFYKSALRLYEKL
ncbi:MAG: hypothetical protein M0R05_06155 [Bacilli bacterium]|nr:hypothetical protein [Bacilli bacterium]MDD4388629.1 hypothetical protein [Bacilli bacterium]